jgi:hypothetical protein
VGLCSALELLLPRGDRIGMNVELFSKLCNRSIVLQGSQSHLRLEGRCMISAGTLILRWPSDQFMTGV